MALSKNSTHKNLDRRGTLGPVDLALYLLAVLVALAIRWLLIEAYVIPSGSMLPSLLIQDHIFVNKLIYGMRVPFSKAVAGAVSIAG